MATAGDRLQIVLSAKDEITSELKQVKAEFKRLETASVDLNKRMQAGEQGLQREYEQTRLELVKNTAKQKELGRAASEVRTELRKMTTDGTAGMKRLDRSTDDVGRSMDRTQTASSKMSVGWGKMMGVVGGVTAGIASLSGAFRFLSSSIEEAREQRKATAQLAAVLRSMGRTEAPKEIMRLVDQMVRMSGLEDDEILSSVNLLLTFGEVTGETFKKSEKAAVDLAAAFHMDLQSATVMVGKALNNPIGGLTSLMRVGVAFTETQKEKIKSLMEEGKLYKAQKIIMGELERQVGGSAEAQVDGIDKMRVAWKDMKQAIGDTLLSVGTGSVDAIASIEDITKAVKRNKRAIVSALEGIISWSLTIISVWLKIASTWLRLESIVINGVGYVIGAVSEFTEVLELLGVVDEGTAQRIGETADSFRGAGDSAGAASKKFDAQAKKVGALGESMRVARDRTDQLNAAMRNVQGTKKLKLVIETVVEGFQNLGVGADPADFPTDFPKKKKPKQRWMGGPVLPGSPYLVGEIGPELFVPTVGPTRVIGADGPELRDFHTSGVVIPNHLLAPVVSVSAPAGPQTVHSGATVTIGTVNATRDVDVEAAVLQATLRAERIARERR